MSKRAQLRFPPEARDLPEIHKHELIKSLAEELGISAPVIPIHTTHDPERTMWTPDEVPVIAALEDWLYGTLAGHGADLIHDTMYALDIGLSIAAGDTPLTWVNKSFGPEAMDYLEKSTGSFRLADVIRMNQKEREKLFRYVSDGGVYSREQIGTLQKFLDNRTPDYGPLFRGFAVRSVFLGKLKSALDEENLSMLSVILAQLPVHLSQVEKGEIQVKVKGQGKDRTIKIPPFSDAEVEAVHYAEQQAARYVTHASDRFKRDVQAVIVQSRRSRASDASVKQQLLDTLGEANRDWRRIALTEITDAMANGYLASLPVGTRVVGQGSAHACPHCTRLVIGKPLTYVKEPGDPLTEIWIGKSNYGRKARDYWATVPMHPHCRCRWAALATFQGIDEEGRIYIRPLEELVEEYKQRGLIHPEYHMDTGAP